MTRSSDQVQAPGHPPAPGSRGKRTERTGRCRTMPAAAADSLIPAAMRAAQWSWSRLQTGSCRSRRLHGWHEGGSTARVLRRAPQAPCRSAHPVRRHVLEEGGGRLGVVEQVHDAGRRPVETSRIDHASPRSATVGWRRYAALGTDVVHQVRRTAAGWCGSIVKRPCLAPTSRAKPCQVPTRHTTPSRAVKSSAAGRSPQAAARNSVTFSTSNRP